MQNSLLKDIAEFSPAYQRYLDKNSYHIFLPYTLNKELEEWGEVKVTKNYVRGVRTIDLCDLCIDNIHHIAIARDANSDMVVFLHLKLNERMHVQNTLKDLLYAGEYDGFVALMSIAFGDRLRHPKVGVFELNSLAVTENEFNGVAMGIIEELDETSITEEIIHQMFLKCE